MWNIHQSVPGIWKGVESGISRIVIFIPGWYENYRKNTGTDSNMTQAKP